MRTVRSTGFVVVVEDRQLLVEAVADRALPDHRQLRVDVDGAGARARGRSASRSTAGRRPRARSAARRSTVSTHRERKRVSNENSPVGSVSDASMSPRSSLTTNVLPSRILTSPSLIAASSRIRPSPRFAARRRRPRKSRLTTHHQLCSRPRARPRREASPKHVRLALLPGSRSKSALLARSDAVGGTVLARHGEVALRDRDSHRSVFLPAELEAHRAAEFLSEGS